ncbi:murein hydrolase activator EnvC family protein [Porphyromonas levii]|uniref:murein hydrolase activator EnvC family protein n=1 Tax=Porphyromonas levii TaxID=28114 RepID=UPI00036AF717|nr:peptidoglycan DD-metalloendopeptidase family protein [Porphyromonas levii]MBR8713798.1 Murein hydrolase activator EnvC [Porphyromonas levii]MBR8715820.1 Murein hydrolase activator EnvC [Porphyromonas levii]MBR8728368.1 Murein hydrolase activator EnvC [Porphyromonas levii]MBR8736670.1 Murein hydrolase activator EnvC [Porphyromonas levii]MBR8769783.1 Murein hydrolase activator EnvC [Porphyromonas levii]
MKGLWRWIIVALLLGAMPLGVAAQQKSKEVQRLEERRKKLQAEIARVDKELQRTASSVKEQLQQLTLLEGQIKSRQGVIDALGSEIKATDHRLYQLEQEITKLQAQFDKRQEAYVESLRALQRGSSVKDQLLFILAAEDFAQGLRRARYLKEYATWQRQEGLKLKELRQKLDKQKTELELQRQQKATLLQDREQEQRSIEADKSKVATKVKALKGQEGKLRKELANQQRKAQALNRQIEAQIAKEIREAEEARRKAEAAQQTKAPKRKAATKGGYAMTAEETKLSANFADNRGKLPWPISGSGHVVGHYGVQQHSGLRHVQVQNNGIDIQGASGAEARAVFDGVVTTIFALEGYNNSVIVRHGNYLTVYSNLTSVYVTKGSKVKTGQALGKIYADPDRGGITQLHFQVWKERTKLNPEQWIRR